MSDDLRSEIARLEARLATAQSKPLKPKKSEKVKIVETNSDNSIVYESPPSKKPIKRSKQMDVESSSEDDAKKAAMKEKMAKLRALRKQKKSEAPEAAPTAPTAPEVAPAAPKPKRVTKKQATAHESAAKSEAVTQEEPKRKRATGKKKVEESAAGRGDTRPHHAPRAPGQRLSILPLEASTPIQYDTHICDCPRCKDKHDA